MPTRSFDVVIIGGGNAGMGVTVATREAGLRVAMLESDLLGGTCPNRGCMPKKVLVAARAMTAPNGKKGLARAAAIASRIACSWTRTGIAARESGLADSERTIKLDPGGDQQKAALRCVPTVESSHLMNGCCRLSGDFPEIRRKKGVQGGALEDY
jgi:hypothetical protein